MLDNSPKPIITALQAMILHTFGVQVVPGVGVALPETIVVSRLGLKAASFYGTRVLPYEHY